MGFIKTYRLRRFIRKKQLDIVKNSSEIIFCTLSKLKPLTDLTRKLCANAHLIGTHVGMHWDPKFMYLNDLYFDRQQAEVDGQTLVDMAEEQRKHSFSHMLVVISVQPPVNRLFMLAY
jgi:hypothetical protein